MAYTILYNTAFIRLPKNNFVPLIEVGDNNVWEWDNKTRARDWEIVKFYTKGKNYISEEGLLNLIREEETILKERDKNRLPTDEKYDPKHFGYFASVAIYGKTPNNTTYNRYLNFFKRAMKKALTVEEWLERGISISVGGNVYETSEEMFEELLSKGPCEIKAHGTWSLTRIVNSMKKQRTYKEKKPVTVDKYFVVVVPNDRYLYKVRKNGYSHSDFYYAKKFRSEKLAQKTVKHLIEKMGKEGFYIKQVDKQTKFYV